MDQITPLQVKQHLQQYVTGFLLSIALTLIAYYFAVSGGVSGWGLMLSLTGMALLQFIIQLVFFLHMRDETEPRWKLMVFNLAILLLSILVFGTLWIMQNLDRHMITPQQGKDYNDYIVKDEGFGR